MKKFFLSSILLLFLIISCGCTKEPTEITDAQKFKQDYESLNGQTNASGIKHRNVSIPSDNPFVYATAEEVAEKINNQESFYVYFGFNSCPWCRSAIEMAIKIAKEKNIQKIYYVDVLNIRDTLELDANNKVVTKTKGSDGYYKLIEQLKNVLSDYTLKDSKGNSVKTNEKRIFAPNYVRIVEGKAEKLVEGTSDKQKDSHADLTEELLNDEEKIFTDFFKEIN